MAGHDPLAPENLIGHTKDGTSFHVPRALGERWDIPQLHEATEVDNRNSVLEPLDFQITRFMVIELAVAVCCVAVFAWVAGKISTGSRPKGRLWNTLEAMLLFIRDQVARPAIGHDADKFLPFLWTMFFFVLGCNLFGMLPWAGSPTGALATTIVLAVLTFGTVIAAGTMQFGVVGFWKNQVPHMDLTMAMAIIIKPMIFAIEILGLLIKHIVLAVRLLANMLAGHLVLAVFVAFVAAVAIHFQVKSFSHPMFLAVSVASIAGAVALSLLELFVAFLQAYIFTFLSALFIGMAVHEH